MKIETRNIVGEIRTSTNTGDTQGRRIEGYAALFNVKSQRLFDIEKNIFFYETLDSKAFEGVIEKSDVFFKFNHNDDEILARSTSGTGTLTLSVDEKGLFYSFDSPQTALGDEVLDAIRRKDLRNSSFAFYISEGGDSWKQRNDGDYDRNITQIADLVDVSAVWQPAYSDTTVTSRNLNKNNIDMTGTTGNTTASTEDLTSLLQQNIDLLTQEIELLKKDIQLDSQDATEDATDSDDSKEQNSVKTDETMSEDERKLYFDKLNEQIRNLSK